MTRNKMWRRFELFLISIFFIPMVVVGLSICSITMALLLPPSLIIYYMSHLAQISRNCRADSKKIAVFRVELGHYIASCFMFVALMSLVGLLIFRYSPGLKHRNIHDLPIWKWVAVLEVICIFGFCTMMVGANRYLNWRFRNLNVDLARFFEGLTGLASCGFILLAVLSVTRVAPVLKKPTILGLQARKWLLVILFVLLAHNAIRILTSLATAWLRILYEHNTDPPRVSPSEEPLFIIGDCKLFEAVARMILSYLRSSLSYLPEIIYYLLPSEKTREWIRRHVVYFAQGLSRSINFLLTSLLFLLTWILYFGTRLNRTSATIRDAYDYVTWTLLCVFIISISWLVKDAIVLSRASRVVYDRFHVKISQLSTQLWLLGILGARELDTLDIDWNNRNEGLDQDKSEIKEKIQKDHNGQEEEDQRDNKGTQEGDVKDHCEIDMIDEISEDEDSRRDDNNGQETKTPTSCGLMDSNTNEAQGEEISSNSETTDAQITRAEIRGLDKKVRQLLVPSAGQKDRLPIHNIEGMAAYFLAAEGLLSKKSYVSDICKKWGRRNRQESKPPFMDLVEKETEEEAVRELCGEIQKKTFDNWTQKAHKSCLDLARSLSGAKEVVDSLNQIIAWLIIGVAIVTWLLLTGIATTKVIVLIASPVLAASFIFGDTCKTFFEGFMFAYVLHPFTVGDQCTIDGNPEVMVVMRIGIWKTIFSKVGSKGEVIYPNSVLASSPIVNLTGIDPEDDDELNRISSI